MSLKKWFGFHPNNPQRELESKCEVLFHVFSWLSFFWPLMNSVSLEFLLTWSSVFSSNSCIFSACSASFSWRAVDSIVMLLMLFWSYLASVSIVSVFLCTASILMLSSSNLVLIFPIILFVIFFGLFSISLVRKVFKSSDICFMSILFAAMFIFVKYR